MKIDQDTVIRAFSPTAVPPVGEDAGTRPFRPQVFLPGQQVKGEVLARLSDQVYLVRIAGQEYRTELPLELRAGDQLELTFRTAEPRLSFALSEHTVQASPATISPAAYRLSRLMALAQGAASVRPDMAFAPLLDAHPFDPAGMAASLQRSLSFSGLFYESHLLRWLSGERTLAELLKESRARLSALRGRENGEECRNLRQDVEALHQETTGPDASPLGSSEAAGTLEEMLGTASLSSLPLVREQLAVLLSGVVRWQGEVWPDQEMEWDLEREAEGPEGAEEPAWRTTIRLQLPNLGTVSATLAVSGEGIRGELLSDSPATREFMGQGLTRLQDAMAESGLRLHEMVIECESKG